MRTDASMWGPIALVLAIAGCGGDFAPPVGTRAGRGDGPLVVAVVNSPLAYLAGRIGGDAVEVILPIPRDVDPAFWRPIRGCS